MNSEYEKLKIRAYSRTTSGVFRGKIQEIQFLELNIFCRQEDRII